MKRSKKYVFFSILWILAFFAFLACDTANNVEHPDKHYFVKYYGGDGNQQGVDMVALNDGSFLLLGNHSETSFESEIYLLRVDAEGVIIWEKRLSGNEGNITKAIDIEPTNDGNFIVLSDFHEVLGDSSDLKLLKISPDGVVLDSVITGTPANDLSRSVTPLDDGGFIVSGTTELTATWTNPNETDPDLGDAFNYRFDQNLDQLSTTNWGPVNHGFGANLDVAVKAVQSQVGYYVFGYTNSTLTNLNPNERLGLFYFARSASGTLGNIDYPGNIIKVNDTEIHSVQQVAPSLGSGFLVIGTSQNNVGVSEIFIARLRNSLVFEDAFVNDITLYQTIPVGRNIRGVSATISLAGAIGYIVTGDEVRSTGATNIWVSKIDQSGIIQWSSTFGSEAEDDAAAAVAELPDGKIVILGTMGLADNQSKMAFIKVNPRGQLLK